MFFSTFLFTCFAAFSFAEEATKSDVIVLTESNFELETQAATGATTGDWLVEFYAPWCGHCKHLQPIWEELATATKQRFNIAKVDVTANRGLGTRFDIKGFPTIKFFSGGKVYDYSGRRSKEEFIKFLEGGYKNAPNIEVPAMPTIFEQAKKAVSEPILAAYNDIQKGRYATPNVFLLAMPLFVLVVLTFAICVIPEPESEKISNQKVNNKKD